ncbi:MAG: hypothetical protein Q9192_007350 [Flavoplaca navasiana]
MAPADLLFSQFIKHSSRGGVSLAIHYATRTTSWNRVYCSPELQADFAAVAEAAKFDSKMLEDTAKVTMKESEHQSEMDKRMHYTVYCHDKDGNELGVKHLTRDLASGTVTEQGS